MGRDAVLKHLANMNELPGCADPSQVEGYPNGRLPNEVLCEPSHAPGHKLRTDAARAFDAMAAAYQEDTGEELCFGGGYRTFAEQVALKKVKPVLAAKPGTSNHGWGVAVDFCGGVNEFGTPQHEWMRNNAYLFGWMHPAWAQVNGSKPEPWHWEYSPALAASMADLFGAEAPRGRAAGEKQGAKRTRAAANPRPGAA